MVSKIQVFLSAPSALSPARQHTYDQLLKVLDRENFEPRALGRTDYPSDFPLREVAIIASHCSGGIILGFTQIYAGEAVFKFETPQASAPHPARFPTPWNQLEAGILFGMGVPLMVFREEGVSGGVFDDGVTDVFLQKLPLGGFDVRERAQMQASIQMWAGRVRERYRDWSRRR